MAARLNPAHDERTRAKIQTSQIINRLQDFVFDRCKMEKSQVTAAIALLKKTLPDLQATQHSGDPEKPIKHEFAWLTAEASES